MAVFQRVNWPGASRILRPGHAGTMDFSAGRLIIEVDDNERISRLFCG
jgi:hypothetical protein